jgi:hypothetical protein
MGDSPSPDQAYLQKLLPMFYRINLWKPSSEAKTAEK